MDPLSNNLWKCSKLTKKTSYNKTKDIWTFSLLWVSSAFANLETKFSSKRSYAKEVCLAYKTEKECNEGSI